MVALLAFMLPQAMNEAYAQLGGKEVVDAVCAACHSTGEQGAPKIGDKEAWAELAARGLTGLTESALKGFRNMPAHGGDPELSDIEIERAITYMVNQSGGTWFEPVSGVTPAVERRAEQVVQVRCAICHQTGVGGAPGIGDQDAWIPRLKRGFDLLVRSAIHGHGAMPPRGGLVDLTDSEIRGAILYMYYPGIASVEEPPAVLPTTPDHNHKIREGIEIFLGVISAESIRAQYPKDSPESLMHGGIPSAAGYYHVNISIFDSKTGAPIKDAQVVASVRGPMGGERKELEFVKLGNMASYGNYFRMPSNNPYTITVRIRKPGVPQPITANFDYKHY